MGILTNLLESDASILVESVVAEEIRKVGAYDYEPIFREIAEVLYEDYSQQIQDPQVLKATLQEALDIAALTIALFEAGNTGTKKVGYVTVPKGPDGGCSTPSDLAGKFPNGKIVDVSKDKSGICMAKIQCNDGYHWDESKQNCVPDTPESAGKEQNQEQQPGLLDKAKHWAHEHPYQAAAAGAGAALGAGLVGYGAYKLGKKVWEKLKNR